MPSERNGMETLWELVFKEGSSLILHTVLADIDRSRCTLPLCALPDVFKTIGIAVRA